MEALDHLGDKKRESDAEKEQKKEERYNQSYALDRERLEIEKRRVQVEEARAANEAKNLEINNVLKALRRLVATYPPHNA